MIAHGGVAGAVVEALVLVAVAGVLLAVWLRERRGDGEAHTGGPARLRDDDEPGP